MASRDGLPGYFVGGSTVAANDAKTRTVHAPRRGGLLTGGAGRRTRGARVPLGPSIYAGRVPEGVYPAVRQELMPIAMASLVLGFLSFLVCSRNGWLLLYGDAVAHLGIARRILDARYPGLAQLGGVWLPLPHVLMLPFAQRMDWWQNGFAGAMPSILAYIVGNLGLYKLARRLMPVSWAFAATAFMALNPNLLYLATTAMTEPLFLALLVWVVVVTMEAVEALGGAAADGVGAGLDRARVRAARVRLPVAGGLILAMVLTRYDGWVVGAAVWMVLAVAWWRSGAAMRRATRGAFAGMTALAVAGPVLWLTYNAVYEGDWLDFVRGPFSAGAIERKTSPPSAGRYHGWHNPLYAFLYYTRAAQLDAAAWETGFALFAGSVAGSWLVWRGRLGRGELGREGLGREGLEQAALLLWVPLPFYLYSMAYSSVPIFIPQLYPKAWYNTRYGMEMLPAFAVFGTLAVWKLGVWLKGGNREQGTGNREFGVAGKPWRGRVGGWLLPAALVGLVVNAVVMFGTVGTVLAAMGVKAPVWVGRPPLVFEEAVVNSRTRIPFEKALSGELLRAGPGATIMIDTNDHIGAVQDAGIPLVRLVSPMDSQRFEAAKKDPAGHAGLVVALDGDTVAAAVKAHPEGLVETEILCHTGQPCARIYRSERFGAGGRR